MTEKTAISNAKDTWKNNGRFDVSVKMKEYKCFRDEYVGFDRIMPINVIIGRNNSGKSALLDMIQAICSRAPSASEAPTIFQLGHSLRFSADLVSTFEYSVEIKNFECTLNLKHQSPNTSFGDYYSQQTAEAQMFDLLKKHRCRIVCQTNLRENLVTTISGELPNDSYGRSFIITINPKFKPYIPEIFREVIFRRIRAERDIVPEPKSNSDETIAEDGRGATNVINLFCSNEDHNEFVIRDDLLDALNIIFKPDNEFEEIRVVSTPAQDGKEELWEVVLYESEKNRVNLSQSGSGLKTVLLVLLNLLVVPEIPQKGQEPLSLDTFIFAFEELENNLHPSLLRRLYKFIEDFVIAKRCYVFITTHSNVVIDFFSRSPYAQLVHVTHDGKQASAKTIETFTEKSGIFDDLGVRASDLLQANGIVWLEGPSDRIYFNKWVGIFSNGQLTEHRDYECAFYGGALLSHYEANATDGINSDFIDVLKINRNCILIADSDRTSANDELKPRLKNFVEKSEVIIPRENIWITECKEIENYIPVESAQLLFGKDNLKPIEQYGIFYSDTDKRQCYWKHSPNKTFNKVDFAAKVIATYPSDRTEAKKWLDLHDLHEKMTQICSIITAWNRETRNG